MPTSHRQRRTIAMSQSILTPSAVKTSAAPDLDEKARLPCLATGTPQPATTRALAVEMLKLPEPSPPVPTVSIVPGGASIASALARMIRAAPVISSTVSPRTRSPIRKAPICDGVALPLMMMSKAASASLSESGRPAATCASSGFRSAAGTLIAIHSGRRCATSPFTFGAAPAKVVPLYQPRQSEGIGAVVLDYRRRGSPARHGSWRKFDVGLSAMGLGVRDSGMPRRGGFAGLAYRAGTTGRTLR